MPPRFIAPRIGSIARASRKLHWADAAGLSIALAALLGFAGLAASVLDANTQPFNVSVLLSLHAHASPTLNTLALSLTYLGGVIGSTLIGCGCAFWLLSRRRYFDAASLAVILLGGFGLMLACKDFYQEPRPNLFPSLAPTNGYSFPSGHSLISVCLYGFLGQFVLAGGLRCPRRWCAAIFLFGMAPAIIWSRLYLGVHWPTDVAAGALIAVSWLTSCLLARRLVRVRRGSRQAATAAALESDPGFPPAIPQEVCA